MGFDACYKITRGIENDITCSITFFIECKIQKLSDVQKSQQTSIYLERHFLLLRDMTSI